MKSTQSTAAELDSSGSIGHYIGGREAVASGNTQAVFNPATGSISKQRALADADIVEQALSAASDAFPSLRNTPPQKRAQILFRFKQLLQQHADDICQLSTAEQPKVLDDARGSWDAESRWLNMPAEFPNY